MAPSVEETAEPLLTEFLVWKQMTGISHLKEVGASATSHNCSTETEKILLNAPNT